MKKKISIAAPIVWAVFTLLWVVVLCMRIQMDHTETSLLVLTAFCIVGGIINTFTHWQRYKRSKECADDAPSGNDSV